MKLIISYIVILASAFVLSGCNEEVTPNTLFSAGEGGLNLLLPTVEEDIKIPVIYTRADTTLNVEVDPNVFALEIDGPKPKSFDSFSAMRDSGVPLLLPIGSYVVKAYFPINVEHVSEEPYFEGIQSFEIVEKQTTNVDFVCKFKSLGVELQLSDRFKKLLEEKPYSYDYRVTVLNGKADKEFNKENMSPCYFKEGCERLVVKVNIVMNGLPFPERTWYFTNNGNAPRQGEYYVITLDAGKSDVKMTSFLYNKEEGEK